MFSMATTPAQTDEDGVFEVPAQPFEILDFIESLEAEFPDIPREVLARITTEAAQSGIPMRDGAALMEAVRMRVRTQAME